MRLTIGERAAIREAVSAAVGADSRVRLFGSRVDDAGRGGDIDLLVELTTDVDRPALVAARIGARIQQLLGERRIDVVLVAPNVPEQPIHRVARESAIEL